jgi:diguanylate cyclase (GGDEF)-like protein/PAS domain S-box-containing protein
MPDDLKILMLEDELADAELATLALRKAGIAFSSLRVDTRDAFVAALEGFHPDIILADYRLPTFDGLAALNIAVERAPDVPFVFVSGAMGEEFAIETLHRGAADYVLKNHLSKLAPAVIRAMEEAAERNLRRKLAAIVESSEDAIFGKTPDGRVTTWNPGAEKMFGYSAAEIVGKSLDVLAPPGGEQTIAELLAVVAGGKSVAHYEISCRAKDGRSIEVSLSLSPIRDSSGTISGISAIARDITERKAAEAALLRLNREVQDSEGRLRTLVQTIPDLIWLKDIEGIYLSCNPQFERFFGAPEAEIVGKTDYDFVDKELADSFRENDGKAMAAGKPTSNEEWVTFADNGYRALLETTKTPMRDHTGKPIGVLGIARDITERHKNEEQLRIAATAFEAQEGIVITNADKVILQTNRAFSSITGYALDEVVGKTPHFLQSGRHDMAYYKAMWDQIHRVGSWQGEIWDRRKNGEIYPEWLNITAVKNNLGEITHYVGTFIDFTARKAAEKEIEHLAFFDLLTQLPNRRLLMDRLQQALAGSSRSRRRGALLFIDLDNFKMLNDTRGHDVGDQLLIKVADLLATCVREGDTISRLGGDEFVVMLEDLSENPQEAAAQTKALGEKILATLGRHYALAGHEHHSTSSIGATLFGGSENSVEEVIKQADIAMYQAKSAGRNTLRFFDPDMQAVLTVRANLEAALRQGILQQQFVLYYQPQVDGVRGIIGAEALIRWQHPERGMVSPAQFIPLAEETGLILPIGQWVLEEACAQLKAWAVDPGTRDLRLAINVSAQQFRQENYVDQVVLALERSGAPAARLKLELTESLVLDDIEGTIKKMHALKQLGVGFSMDDFGTGYSSLSYLTRLPLDQVKIDQSFVRNLPDNSNDAAIVQTIITMARSLGLAVIAEGVETEAQRQFLERHGCPIYQGYLFSKPVALAAFEEFMRCR